jgi:hypothetical protein
MRVNIISPAYFKIILSLYKHRKKNKIGIVVVCYILETLSFIVNINKTIANINKDIVGMSSIKYLKLNPRRLK